MKSSVKILGIEGQGNFGFLQAGLAPVIAKYPNVQYTRIAWQDWPKYQNQLWDVVAGHSLGGNAAIQVCRYFAPTSVAQPKLLLTIDPRWESNAGWLGVIPIIGMLENLGDFKAPNAVCHNFYQRGIWMHGYPVDGAEENTIVPWTNHLMIPGSAQVRNCLDSFLAGEK